MTFYVYMLECADGSIYTGHTDDLDWRLAAHQLGTFRGYTANRRPVRLIFQAQFASREEAFAAERRIKGWSRRKKLALTRGDWTEIRGLPEFERPVSPPLVLRYLSTSGKSPWEG
jgi:predicted GIY-YIG superfamily endonuclease